MWCGIGFDILPHPRPLSTHFPVEKLVERGAIAQDFVGDKSCWLPLSKAEMVTLELDAQFFCFLTPGPSPPIFQAKNWWRGVPLLGIFEENQFRWTPLRGGNGD